MSDVAPQQTTDLAARTPQELRALWRKTFGTAPPIGARREFLALLLAYGLQEHEHGGLSLAVAKQLRRYESSDAAALQKYSVGGEQANTLSLGTRLIRSWGGSVHEVIVIDKAFAYRGQQFGSLTEIAELITGAHWSGPRFFGLKRPSKSARTSCEEQ
jgi:hypothetical protein